jgi:hypothetical protein
MPFNAYFRLRALPFLWILIALGVGWAAPSRDAFCLAQMIGSPPAPPTTEREESEKVISLLGRLGERLTAQELNTKRISCQEEVSVERSGEKGRPGPVRTQRFIMTGEMKQHGTFSIDVGFVEEHQPVESSDPSSHKSDPGQSIEASLLVRDSFSAASEFLGLNHREIYAQRFLGKETLEGRGAFVVAFQTVKQLESRKVNLADQVVPMRIVGKVWLDAANGTLLRLAVQQTKLPKSVREFSYDIRYAAVPELSSVLILPAAVHFRRVQKGETIATTQIFSNCRAN